MFGVNLACYYVTDPNVCYDQLHALRRLMQGDVKHPKAPLGNNYRPPQPLHHRPLRTNIDFNVKQVPTSYVLSFPSGSLADIFPLCILDENLYYYF